MESEFRQLFNAEKSLRDYPGLTWKFGRRDLNESARDLLLHLDRVLEILAADSCMFLSTIELDVERGRFPEVLLQHLWDETVSDSDAIFVAPINRIGSPGRLTFETRPGQIARALRYNDGWRWGAYLRLWGFQIHRESVPDLIELSPFQPEPEVSLAALYRASRAAWVTSNDVDVLALWLNPAFVSATAAETRRLRALTA